MGIISNIYPLQKKAAAIAGPALAGFRLGMRSVYLYVLQAFSSPF